MSAMASQITCLTIVYSAVYSGACRSKKTSRDLTIRRLIGYWNRAQLSYLSEKYSAWVGRVMLLCCSQHYVILDRLITRLYDLSSLYRKTSNIRRTSVGNKIVDHSDVVGASPVGAAPSTSSGILDLTSGFKGFGKDSRKTVRESFKCWDLVRLVLENWRYIVFALCELYLQPTDVPQHLGPTSMDK